MRGSTRTLLAVSLEVALASALLVAAAGTAFAGQGFARVGVVGTFEEPAELSRDGSTLVVGAPFEHALRVYRRPAEGWGAPLDPPTVLQPPDNEYLQSFGNHFSISDDGRLIAGGAELVPRVATDAVWVFEAPAAGWGSGAGVRHRAPNAGRGSVTLSGDGETLVTHDPSGTGTEVHVRTRSSGGYISYAGGRYGGGTWFSGVTGKHAVSADGSAISITRSDSASTGYVTVRMRPANGWGSGGSGSAVSLYGGRSGVPAGFGRDVVFAPDGRTVIVGAAANDPQTDDDGRLLLYTLPTPSSSGGSLYPDVALRTTGTAGGTIGRRIQVSDDGATIATGTIGDAAAPYAIQVFVRRGPTWYGNTGQATTIESATPAVGQAFGWFYRLSPDGREVIAQDRGDLVRYVRDTVAPTTTVATTPTAPAGRDGWHVSPVSVALVTGDGPGAGVAETRCVVDPPTPPRDFWELPAGPCPHPGGLVFGATGHHSFYAASIDALANVGAVAGLTFALDAVAPELRIPPSLEVDAPLPGGTNVHYTYSASDDWSGPLPAVCGPGPGAYFPVGATTVRCSATDQAGNTTSREFVVTVHGEPAPVTPRPEQPRTEQPRTEQPDDGRPGGVSSPDPSGEGGPGVARRVRLSRLTVRRRLLSVRVSGAATVRAELARCTTRRGPRRATRCRTVARLSGRSRGAGVVVLAIPATVAAGSYRATATATGAGGRSPPLSAAVTVRR